MFTCKTFRFAQGVRQSLGYAPGFLPCWLIAHLLVLTSQSYGTALGVALTFVFSQGLQFPQVMAVERYHRNWTSLADVLCVIQSMANHDADPAWVPATHQVTRFFISSRLGTW